MPPNNSSGMADIIFGYWLFGFRPIVKVSERGLTTSGREYCWNEIQEFVFSYGVIGPPIGIPHATIKFTDGRKLKINVPRFRRQTEKRRVGFISGVTSAFGEFAHIVKNKSGAGDPLQWGV